MTTKRTRRSTKNDVDYKSLYTITLEIPGGPGFTNWDAARLVHSLRMMRNLNTVLEHNVPSAVMDQVAVELMTELAPWVYTGADGDQYDKAVAKLEAHYSDA
jgi:hypothetical protein